MNQSVKHILLTSCGLSPGPVSHYRIGERNVKAQFSAFALYHLFAPQNKPDLICFILTPAAIKNCWPRIQQEAESAGIACEKIEIVGPGNGDDAKAFLESVAGNIPNACNITLDVTQGLRHHAFLFYALALYLIELRGVTVPGVWYCRQAISEPDRSTTNEFVDLKPVLELSQWFHALRVFRTTGSLMPVSHLVDNLELANALESFSSHFLAGMPLESGKFADEIVKRLEHSNDEVSLPLFDEIKDQLCMELGDFAIPNNGNPKSETLIDHGELDRQANYIDRYIESGQLNLAFGLLREWIVNFIVVTQPESTNWLQRKTRFAIEQQLGALKTINNKHAKSASRKYEHESVRVLMTESQKRWASRWSDIGDVRNSLHHHGMNSQEFLPNNRLAKRVVTDWNDRTNWSPPTPLGGGNGKLLVCPFGLSMGVLFTSISRVQPDRLIVIASPDSVSNVDQALVRSKFSGEYLCLEMSNPHKGIGEFDSIQQQASRWLVESDSVVVNMTGGTTLMGTLVGHLANLAEREFQRPVRRFVAIDNRTPDEQERDPFQLGEIFYLDDESNEKTNEIDSNQSTDMPESELTNDA